MFTNFHSSVSLSQKPKSELTPSCQLLSSLLLCLQLWMGTHPSGPSVLCDISPELNGKTLGKLLEMWPEFLGTIDLCTKYQRKLPFLFKVLSVQKPLSIQVHPDRTLAAKLHLSRPNLYPDSNHKPEMAIAMSKFYALAYFRSHNEIINFMQEYEQLREVIGQDLCSEYIAADEASKKLCLKKCFSSLMRASAESVSISLKSLKTLAETRQCPHLSMFLRIVEYYPDDVGAFAFFFLNLVELAPHEALYIDAREPHCYLHGGKHLFFFSTCNCSPLIFSRQIASKSWPTLTMSSVLV